MADFKFLQNPLSKKWIVSAPRRAKRPARKALPRMAGGPEVARGSEPVCPFCPGHEKAEEEVYRVPYPVIATQSEAKGKQSHINGIAMSSASWRTPRNDDGTSWQVRVLKNKYPFAPIHEVIIHSPSHHKNFDQLPLQQVQLILETYRHQYNEYSHKGQVYIFHNRGEAGGESLPHPHSQLAVVPFSVRLDIPRLELGLSNHVIKDKSEIRSTRFDREARRAKSETTLNVAAANTNDKNNNDKNISDFEFRYSSFSILCPESSQWPDEVWIAPKKRGRAFGEITDSEIVDLAFVLQRLIQIMDSRHNNNFPFNFYIYPGADWYLRIIPRLKVLGGFELGTGIYVNTQNPGETITFIKEHFESPDHEKIKQQHQAEYEPRV